MSKQLSFLILLILILDVPQAFAIEFSSHGYYRTRFEYTHDLDLQRPNPGIVPNDPANDSNDRFGTIAFAQQRFRLNPLLKLNDHISIHGQMDFLDNLLFGQSEVATLQIANPITGTLTLPAANGPFGVMAGSSGDPVGGGGGNFEVRRLYVDLLTSGGKFRIGRQPSQFGLGIFTNDGDGPEGDFGDTFDRILYLAGLDLNGSNRLNFGLAYDFAFENSLDPSVTGVDGGVGSNWNDAMQGGLILLFQNDNFEIGNFAGLRYRDGNDGDPTTTATFIDVNDEDGDGNTIEGIEKPAGKDGDTFLITEDFYANFYIKDHYRLGLEGALVTGKLASGVAIDSVVLDDPAQADFAGNNPLPNPIELPQTGNQNDAFIVMAAMEFEGWWNFGGETLLKAGFASGDSSPLSQRVTQLGFRPDYDIALMMFDVPLGTSPAIRVGGITELGRKPVSPNYINNAIYAAWGFKQKFDITSGVPWAEDFKIGAKVISAYAPSRNLDINFAEVTGVGGLPHVVNASRWYGFEVDLSAEATFFEFMHWSTTAGAFFPGGLYDIQDDNKTINGSTSINPINFDKADIAVAAKTTFIFEF